MGNLSQLCGGIFSSEQLQVGKQIPKRKPIKLYANPATKKPTIGGSPTLLRAIPKKKAKLMSVTAMIFRLSRGAVGDKSQTFEINRVFN